MCTRSSRGTSDKSLLFARDTLNQTKPKKQRKQKRERASWQVGKRRQPKKRDASDKQVNSNNKHERRVDARGSRRCGSVTKETRGRTEARRKQVRYRILALTRPWSARRKRLKKRGEGVVLVRKPTAPQPGSNREEQRAHFPFGDVTGEHGGWGGHASETQRIDNNQCIYFLKLFLFDGLVFLHTIIYFISSSLIKTLSTYGAIFHRVPSSHIIPERFLIQLTLKRIKRKNKSGFDCLNSDIILPQNSSI